MNALSSALIRSVGLAVGAGLLVWVFGVPLLQSSVVATAAFAAGVGYALRPHATETAWPDRIGTRRHGTRREVARLSSSLAAREREVPAPTVARLRSLAERRLARSGIDVSQPRQLDAARRVLGPSVHDALFVAGQPPDHATFLDCLAAVEQLESTAPAASTTRSA